MREEFGRPHLRTGREIESGGHDADDSSRLPINADCAADGGGIGPETRLPQRVANDRDRVSAGLVFPLEKRSSVGGVDPEYPEEIRGDAHAFHFGGGGRRWAGYLE